MFKGSDMGINITNVSETNQSSMRKATTKDYQTDHIFMATSNMTTDTHTDSTQLSPPF